MSEAAELGAAVLVLVCGPGVDRDLVGARREVTEVTEAIAYPASYASTSSV